MKTYKVDEIKKRLKKTDNWKYKNKKITKSFELKDFADALSFTVKVGIEAEKMGHHPDILIHGWNKVDISLTTHDEGGITKYDFDLVKNIDGIK